MLHTRGVRLHAAVAGAPTDPLIVLLHGAYGGWFDFRHTIAPLASLGYHVAALDQRGFGLSDKPAPRSGDTLHLLRGDLKGAIATLGHTEATIIAADTGAVIASALAEAAPHLVRRTLTLPAEPPLPLLLRHAPARVLQRLPRGRDVLDRAWRNGFARGLAATDDISADTEEALALRLRARRIDNALPHILATHRLRGHGGDARGQALDLGPLAHVVAPQNFVAAVGQRLDA
ncbi:alpha/beta fold hydrolase [Corynebacterium sp. HMSC074A01]|uniref:alpha/beta fold hydrolase n=1 Tax=Corynebacterium sp. HMSC074A01 TaxID=1715030 RepID=UPI0008A629CA|nr:alpha/beta hydrolase [Corynebacterium sp. HMSC074A01]OHF39892.1 hypothetical protein HMPREF2550_01440 [Corynebacterium sp. HMSC074A01]